MTDQMNPQTLVRLKAPFYANRIAVAISDEQILLSFLYEGPSPTNVGELVEYESTNVVIDNSDLEGLADYFYSVAKTLNSEYTPKLRAADQTNEQIADQTGGEEDHV